MSKLHLYSTAQRKVREFKPLNGNSVSLYSCGVTVYSDPHIGNMRAYAFASLLKNTLIANGYDVNAIINITNIGHLVSDADDGEDKMQKAAKKEGKTAWEISKQYTDIFMRYMDALELPHANKYPLATDYITEQITFVKSLEDKGYTYITDDGVYFDTSKFGRYTEFAKIDVEGLNEGIRVSASGKKNKTDFALWKFSPIDEHRDMEWESPWGVGFPGWHIECSAMAMSLLGEQIDIHTGGIDHISVHHSNEIAQSEALTGKTFANYWMHVNFLQIEAEPEQELPAKELKMSKSKGNVITVDTLIEKGYSPMSLKYLYYTAHYRNELSFSYALLDSASRSLQRLYDKAYRVRSATTNSSDSLYLDKIKEAINSDLNTPLMLSVLYKALSDDNESNESKLGLIEHVESILGLGLLSYEPIKVTIPDYIIALADKRITARNNKDWTSSDEIRDQVSALGYQIKDAPNQSYEIVKK
jgi:cysteinyl-tRNA synthetase